MHRLEARRINNDMTVFRDGRIVISRNCALFGKKISFFQESEHLYVAEDELGITPNHVKYNQARYYSKKIASVVMTHARDGMKALDCNLERKGKYYELIFA